MQFSAHDYQRYAIDYILSHPVTAAILDMGLGKTVITLSAINDLLYDFFLIRKVLVVAPGRVYHQQGESDLAYSTEEGISGF